MPGPDDEELLAELEAFAAGGAGGETRAPKAAPVPLTDDDLERLAERQELARRRGLAREMGDTSFLGDAFSGLMPTEEGARARERQSERTANLWDQFTQGDARLGGRNPIAPIIGTDRRAEAPLVGFTDTATLGHLDEIGGAARAAVGDETYEEARDELRGRAREAREQAPEATGVGQTLGVAPLLLAPGATTARGLVAQGAGMGAAAAHGESESSLSEDPAQLLRDVGEGAVLGTGASLVGMGGARALTSPAVTRTARAAVAPARRAIDRVAGRAAATAPEAAPGAAGAVEPVIERFGREVAPPPPPAGPRPNLGPKTGRALGGALGGYLGERVGGTPGAIGGMTIGQELGAELGARAERGLRGLPPPRSTAQLASEFPRVARATTGAPAVGGAMAAAPETARRAPPLDLPTDLGEDTRLTDFGGNPIGVQQPADVQLSDDELAAELEQMFGEEEQQR